MSDATVQAEAAPKPLAAPPKPWWQRPQVVGGLLGFVLFMAILTWLGTRRQNFGTDVRPDGDVAFDVAFAWSLVPDMLNALSVTAMATLYGFMVAIVLGFLLALGRRSTNRIVRMPFAAFIEFVRSTPLLAQLIFLYTALPDFGIILRPLQALVLGLGVHYATYCSEAYRAGINSVPKGQWEATTALNLDSRTTWLRVVLPQAIPNVLPALGNFLVAGFKDAPLGATIQVTGVLFFAQTISGRTFSPVEPFLLIGVGFLLVSIPAAWGVRRLEKRIGYERT